MNKSKVYFTDFHCHDNENLLQKLKRLCITAGIKDINFKNNYTVIKMHFGEYGNLSYLRPNYVKVITDLIKEQGGTVYTSDCNTLYVGFRNNGVGHLECAYANGFVPSVIGCSVVIGDGIKGTSEKLIPINMKHVKEAKIGLEIANADIFISLTHFKGHEATGFGGAIKNIGMGCGSRAGKMEMHGSGKTSVDEEKCMSCGQCIKNCGVSAISFNDKRKAYIDKDICVGCGRCIGTCNFNAISPDDYCSNLMLNEKMAEYAYATVKDKPNFHISLICDVSPNCDCHCHNDMPILPNIGMLASYDMVALDQACVDLCNKANPLCDSVLAHNEKVSDDHFINNHPDTNYKECLAYAQEIGLGSREYELIKI
ncbi:MAG: DUF362 domain-containing protein [Erysipelotrichaceae bacterium]